MKIGIIGEGAIGRYVAENLASKGLGPDVLLVRPGRMVDGDKRRVSRASDLPDDISLMVECADRQSIGSRANGTSDVRQGPFWPLDLLVITRF